MPPFWGTVEIPGTWYRSNGTTPFATGLKYLVPGTVQSTWYRDGPSPILTSGHSAAKEKLNIYKIETKQPSLYRKQLVNFHYTAATDFPLESNTLNH